MKTVWSFTVPPVCTAFWTEEDWDNHALSQRPPGYTGSPFDATEYATWLVERDREYVRRFYASYGIDAIASHISETRNA